MNDLTMKIDMLCDSQNCFNDVSVGEILSHLDTSRLERVIAQAEERFRQKLCRYGFINKTPEYIYESLKARLLPVEYQTGELLGNPDCLQIQGIEHIVRFCLNNAGDAPGKFLKKEAAVKLLLENPPLGLVAAGGCRSIHDLLEHEDIYTIFSIVRITENRNWANSFISAYETLEYSDFETRGITTRILDISKYPYIAARLMEKQTIWEDKLMGTIFGIAYPDRGSCSIPILRTLTRAYHYYCELSFHSRFVDCIGTEAQCFGKRLSTAIRGEFDKYNFFEPHCLSEDLYWRQTFEHISRHCGHIPDMEEWLDCIDVGGFLPSYDGKATLVSFNMLDILTNVSKNKSFPGNTRILSMNIKGRLFEACCGGKDRAEELILKNLDSGLIYVSN